MLFRPKSKYFCYIPPMGHPLPSRHSRPSPPTLACCVMCACLRLGNRARHGTPLKRFAWTLCVDRPLIKISLLCPFWSRLPSDLESGIPEIGFGRLIGILLTPSSAPTSHHLPSLQLTTAPSFPLTSPLHLFNCDRPLLRSRLIARLVDRVHHQRLPHEQQYIIPIIPIAIEGLLAPLCSGHTYPYDDLLISTARYCIFNSLC